MMTRPTLSLVVSLCLIGCDPTKALTDGGLADLETTPYDEEGSVDPFGDSGSTGMDTGIDNDDTTAMMAEIPMEMESRMPMKASMRAQPMTQK